MKAFGVWSKMLIVWRNLKLEICLTVCFMWFHMNHVSLSLSFVAYYSDWKQHIVFVRAFMSGLIE